LNKLQELRPGELQRYTITDWTVLAGELENLGLETEVIEAEFYFINAWLKESIQVMLRRKLGGMRPSQITHQAQRRERFERSIRYQSKQDLFYQLHKVKQELHLPSRTPLRIHFRMVMMK
jgi:hypothetical protein